MKYKIWWCKIVVEEDEEMCGDSFPRRAAIEAIEDACADVIACFSGWGGKLSKAQAECVEAKMVSEEIRKILDDLNCLKSENEKLAYLTTVIHGG